MNKLLTTIILFTHIFSSEIIVSFTTIKERINHIEPMVLSILNQTYKSNKINLYISEEINNIPDFLDKLAQEKKINIIHTKDIGPHTKLIPCLKENWQKNCYIITIDDDIIYPEYLIEKLIKKAKKHNCIACFNGSKINFKKDIINIMPYKNWWADSKKDLYNFAKGVGGVIYKPEFFVENIFDPIFLKICPHNDDVWFNFMRIRKNIPVYIIQEQKFKSVFIPKNKSLWTENQKGRIDKQIKSCLKYLQINNLLPRD